MAAVCEHQPLLRDCTCGLYAFHDGDRALRAMRVIGADVVLGRVRGWGTVVKHEFGWRAQYAAPELFLAFTALGPIARRLEAYFEVPVLQVALVGDGLHPSVEGLKQEEDE